MYGYSQFCDFIGAQDVGQKTDFPCDLILGRYGTPEDIRCKLVAIEQIPLKEDYKHIRLYTEYLSSQPPFAGRISWGIDAGGGGGPYFEDVLDLPIIGKVAWAFVFTSGQKEHQDGLELKIPKRDLIGNCLGMMEDGRLEIDWTIPGAAILKKECLEYQVKLTASANLRYEGTGSAHDDCTSALLMSCWLANFLPLGYVSAQSGGFNPYLALASTRAESAMPVSGGMGSRYPRPSR